MLYLQLYNRLRLKYLVPASQKLVLIRGHYPIPYEGGRHWIVGYATSEQTALNHCRKLEAELKQARTILGPYYRAERRSYRNHELDYDNQELVERWGIARDAYWDKVEEVARTLTDRFIPFPYSMIISWSNDDGPIQYDFCEIEAI